jgi:LPPG:FO 2-phospho-L-lactate transferase
MTSPRRPRITVLTGGVGGARFLRGLTQRIDPARLTVVGNTADDESFFGLHVAPDLDTALYTLADRADPIRGWGVRDETFACLEALGRLGEPVWFRLGDRDLATHLFRTQRLRAGWSLSRVTRALAARHGVRARLLPMSDGAVRTFVHTERGRLAFQQYLVAGRARGRVRRIEIRGARLAVPAPGVETALRTADLVIVAPSNPLVSIGPMLAIPALRRALASSRARRVAISPLVWGRAVRGPLHRMLRGVGHEASSRGVAQLYRGLIDDFVIDDGDARWARSIAALGMQVHVTDTLMPTPARAARLAGTVMAALQGARP